MKASIEEQEKAINEWKQNEKTASFLPSTHKIGHELIKRLAIKYRVDPWRVAAVYNGFFLNRIRDVNKEDFLSYANGHRLVRDELYEQIIFLFTKWGFPMEFINEFF